MLRNKNDPARKVSGFNLGLKTENQGDFGPDPVFDRFLARFGVFLIAFGPILLGIYRRSVFQESSRKTGFWAGFGPFLAHFGPL